MTKQKKIQLTHSCKSYCIMCWGLHFLFIKVNSTNNNDSCDNNEHHHDQEAGGGGADILLSLGRQVRGFLTKDVCWRGSHGDCRIL